MLKEALTDEQSRHDIVLWLVVFGCIFMGVLSLVSVFKNGTFDAAAFGTGFASICGGGSLGYALKRVGEKYGNSDSAG